MTIPHVMQPKTVTLADAPRDLPSLAELPRFIQSRLVDEVAKAGIDVWSKLLASQEIPNPNPGALKAAFINTKPELRAEIVYDAVTAYDAANGAKPAATVRKPAPAPSPPPAAAAPLAAAPAAVAEPAKVVRRPGRPATPPAAPAESTTGVDLAALVAAIEGLKGGDGPAAAIDDFKKEVRTSIGNLQESLNQIITAQEQQAASTQVLFGLVCLVLGADSSEIEGVLHDAVERGAAVVEGVNALPEGGAGKEG